MLPNARLVAQLQRVTETSVYGDDGYLVKTVNTGTYDKYNHPITTTTNVHVACSFTDKPTASIWKDHVDLEILLGEVRFNCATAIPVKGDQFKVVGRFGTTNYPDKTYEIAGITNRDAFGYICALKAVVV